MAEELPPLGKFLGTVGLFTGFIIGWNSTKDFWVALICALVVAYLGAHVGNALHKIIVIAISIVMAVGSSYVRHTIIKGIIESKPQGQQVAETTPHRPLPVTPSKPAIVPPENARVIRHGAVLRSRPSRRDTPDNKTLVELRPGERLALLAPDHNGKGWYHVRHSDTGEEGWVYGDDIEFE